MATKSKITDTQREAFYAELHALLIAGLDFAGAFHLLIDCESDKRTKSMLKELFAAVVRGETLAGAMRRSGVFRPLDYGVVRIGDETGRLSLTLEFLSDYYRKRTAQRRMLTSAVSYPVIILCTAVAVVAFMLAVIVPMFEQVYARMGGELPALTRWIIAFSKSFPACAAIVASVGTTAYIILYANRKRKEVQRWTSELLLRLPFAGAMIRKNHQAQFCKLLSLMTSSGVPLLTSIGMLSDAIEFFPYRESFVSIGRDLEQGERFSICLKRFPTLYDSKLTALIHVGEETNRLSRCSDVRATH